VRAKKSTSYSKLDAAPMRTFAQETIIRPNRAGDHEQDLQSADYYIREILRCVGHNLRRYRQLGIAAMLLYSIYHPHQPQHRKLIRIHRHKSPFAPFV
jgi:hypothetical protein